ncbi:MAG: cytochrome c [Burkholderiales bacterium]|nr:MAG: cytochrome c [Burkholderiales bacterium]
MFAKTAFALGAAALVSGMLLASPAMAQFAKAEDAINYRQSAFTVMSNHMGRLAAMAKGERPFDPSTAQHSARIIDTMAKLPWEAFVPGSDKGETGAKPGLFQNMDDVRKLSERLNGETGKLVTAAGSLDSLRTQVGATGAACKACHDKYREL